MDKFNHFPKKYSSNSIIDDNNQNFPLCTEQAIISMKITAKKVAKAIQELDTAEATGYISFIVLKQCKLNQ